MKQRVGNLHALRERMQERRVDGLVKIVSIKASINLGLRADLKLAFPKLIPIARPLIQNK